MDADTNNQPLLIRDRYPQQDLFICDVADAVLKDLMSHMEHPFYSLSKKPETAVRKYEHNGNWIEIVPSVRECRQIILLHRCMHFICTAATNDAVCFAYRVAMPLHCLR